jgi:NAD(P)-dependent dehydrogenase (short-subunit alcohol dehydrogenase family)
VVLRGKVAVVTGAASGIGFGLAERLVREGAKVVLADVEEAALREAEARLGPVGEVIAAPTDVSKEADMEALASLAHEAFGPVDVLCNNAGVGVLTPIWAMTANDWRWMGDVNVGGLLNGLRVFVPGMIERDEGYVVNTSSVAGVASAAWAGYGVTKHAVVACSEALYHGLRTIGSNVKVSVVLAGWARTRIVESERNRPPDLQNGQAPVMSPRVRDSLAGVVQAIQDGADPSEIADAVIEGMQAGRFYILTDPEAEVLVRFRMEDILEGREPTRLG